MTKRYLKTRNRGGICCRCDHDLVVREDGFVYCTNGRCRFAKKPHATGQHPNVGVKEEDEF